jgi:MFS family permease
MTIQRRFASVATAGVTFQAGSAAVDSATIISALVFQLTGSPVAVGAVTAILRLGWLLPQLFVGFLAQRATSSMSYYKIGAFGRATAISLLALVLALGANWPLGWIATAVLVLWTVYAFVSGIVAVPYNDIVARAVPSNLRSRLLAARFFGGGLLALGVAAIADRLVSSLPFPSSYAAIAAIAALLMFLSACVFVLMGEPETTTVRPSVPTFASYLREGVKVFRTEHRFRQFVYAQWCGGAVLMALPFYIVQAHASGFDLTGVAALLAAQTAGALASNVLWGWWGDRLGKGSLLRAIALGRMLPPVAVIIFAYSPLAIFGWSQYVFMLVFFVLGALANGLTIAVIGFLMEISPEGKRPAFSGYFNTLTAPAYLLPLVGGLIVTHIGLSVVFGLSLLAAAMQFYFVRRAHGHGATLAI